MRILLLAGLFVLGLAVPTAAEEQEVKARNGGYLGVFLEEADGRITIQRVHAGSGAEKAGFRAGDVIREVNDRRLPNGDALLKRLWSGRPLRVTVERDGETVVVETSTQQLDAWPKVGEDAPRFVLPAREGDAKHDLEAMLEAGKPVVLIFGSFT